MKNRILLCICSLASVFCSAQQSHDDNTLQALEKKLKDATTNETTMRANFALSDHWLMTDTVKALQYLQAGEKLVPKGPVLPMAMALYHRSLTFSKDDFALQQANFLKVDSLLQHDQQPMAYLYRAKAWYEYGRIEQKNDAPKKFVDIILNKAIPLAQKAGDPTLVGKDYLAVAIVFKNTNEFEKARLYTQQAINAFKAPSVNEGELLIGYHTMAEIASLSNNNKDARPYLDSSLAILKKYPGSEYYLSYYNAEGMYYTLESRFKDALQSLSKGVALAQKLHLRYDELRLVMQQFYAYYNDGNFGKARETVEYLLGEEAIAKYAMNRVQLLYGAAATYKAMNNYKAAFSYMEQYSALRDSMSQSKLTNDVHALEIKYQNAEKQKEIDALTAKSIQDSLQAKNARLLMITLISGIVVLLVIMGLLVIIYRNKRKLHAQKEWQLKQQLDTIAQQQQIQFSQAVLQGEEQERKRLARDLHDGLGGMLAGAKINLSTQIAGWPTDSQKTELEKITQQIDDSVQELRRIAHNMMPVSLLKFGLQTAIKDLSESLINDDMHIDFQALNIADNLGEEVQIHIYRIVQELLTNAVRHAQATHIILQCSQDEDRFYITQEDNGIGFSEQQLAKAKGAGFNNIKNRVGLLRGSIDIQAAPGEGTTINIELHVNG
ncbi:signal transduction histidine kinase [Chitinophaga skermanii]|uniref:histidine kinase n=1 Tax=Chitinophaga skermanii TaxID=331697 RepID=A0A327QX35_9BACT|nr:ATP-binding protein [Chitinophaga skermanii]RAJ08182.1 signal transduction histidine kinase [Chitinophaga skermanii]